MTVSISECNAMGKFHCSCLPSECDAMGRTLLLLSTILNMMPQSGAILAATHLYTMSYVGSNLAVYTSECAAMGRLYWLSACAVLLYSLDFFVPLPYGIWGRDWNSIVSVPDHCLFIYFTFQNLMPWVLVSVIVIVYLSTTQAMRMYCYTCLYFKTRYYRGYHYVRSAWVVSMVSFNICNIGLMGRCHFELGGMGGCHCDYVSKHHVEWKDATVTVYISKHGNIDRPHCDCLHFLTWQHG